MTHETDRRPRVTPGSIPPLPQLLSITGPLPLDVIEHIYSTASLPQEVLASYNELPDDELIMLMYLCIWILRGRNNLCLHGQID